MRVRARVLSASARLWTRRRTAGPMWGGVSSFVGRAMLSARHPKRNKPKSSLTFPGRCQSCYAPPPCVVVFGVGLPVIFVAVALAAVASAKNVNRPQLLPYNPVASTGAAVTASDVHATHPHPHPHPHVHLRPPPANPVAAMGHPQTGTLSRPGTPRCS